MENNRKIDELFELLGSIVGKDLKDESKIDDLMDLVDSNRDKDTYVGFRAFTDNKGRKRWIGFIGSAFRCPYDNLLLTTTAWDVAILRNDISGNYGPITMFHDPNLVFGNVDFAMRFGALILEIGTYDDTEFANRVYDFFSRSDEQFTMSIIFEVLHKNEFDMVTDFRYFERTVLPVGLEADEITAFGNLAERSRENVSNLFDSLKEKFLINLLGEEDYERLKEEGSSLTDALAKRREYRMTADDKELRKAEDSDNSDLGEGATEFSDEKFDDEKPGPEVLAEENDTDTNNDSEVLTTVAPNGAVMVPVEFLDALYATLETIGSDLAALRSKLDDAVVLRTEKESIELPNREEIEDMVRNSAHGEHPFSSLWNK